MKDRVIHESHPNGQSHPFKFLSLCGKMIRFGGIRIPGEREVTCKPCLKIKQKVCPHCDGTGLKNDHEFISEKDFE